MLLEKLLRAWARSIAEFQWAPTLGGECYWRNSYAHGLVLSPSFNGHPPLGVNATLWRKGKQLWGKLALFQWAPTLGGECYWRNSYAHGLVLSPSFNGHPPLGVNATIPVQTRHNLITHCFNGHPPLGVNATGPVTATQHSRPVNAFQWAPTLEGECY